MSFANIEIPLDRPNVTYNDYPQSQQYQVDYNMAQYLKGADDYSGMTPKEHILNRPGMYIGSEYYYERVDRVLDLSNPNNIRFFNSMIKWPEGAERLFLEILTNASDNAVESRIDGFNPGSISVIMDKQKVIIRNEGKPLQIIPKGNVWLPEYIFGTLYTGSNYNDKKARTGAGVNGLGAKLTNIYSLEFSVKVGDPYNKKEYYQLWKNNMDVRHEPIIQNYEGPPYCIVEYTMDFSRFISNSNPLQKYNEYDNEAFALYARHAADIGFCCKVPISFNGLNLKVQNIYDYAMLINKNNNCIVHHEYPKGTVLNKKKIGKSTVNCAVNENIYPTMELCILDTPDNGQVIAFVNSMVTRGEGVHVDAANDAVIKKLLEIVNGDKKKSKSLDRKFKLNAADVKRHLTIIISCHLDNPVFVGGNTKDKLRSPKPKINIDENELKKIKDWDVVKRLYAELEAKQFKALVGKGKTTRKKNVEEKKGFDAYYAGTDKSHLCSLFVVEGDSAKAMAVNIISAIRKQNHEQGDYYGVLPLGGKILNVAKASIQRYYDSKKINAFKEYLNVREGLDYRTPQAFNTLRYGKVIYLMDADDDGKHIEALGMNLFFNKFPTLLLIPGFFMTFRTPIITAYKGKEYYKFYTMGDYKQWSLEKNNDLKGWQVDYHKGLGSFDKEDAEQEIRYPLTTTYVYDDQAAYYFYLMFSNKSNDGTKMEDKRKMWITNHTEYEGIEKIPNLPLSSFINYEAIRYSLVDVYRNIPNFRDGFKMSYRKIIHAAYKKWGNNVGSHKAKKIKTAGFAGVVTEETLYPYGESSLFQSIDHMCQHYPGVANIQLLFDHGEHGTRLENGKDASAARYTYTRPTYIWPYLFRNEDKDLLTYIYDEGEYIEPEFYLPVIPLIATQGGRGIGTGFSTFLAGYNPIDVINFIRTLIYGQPIPRLIPWYKGFNGTIEIIDAKEDKKKNELKNAIANLDNIMSGFTNELQNDDTTSQEDKEIYTMTTMFNDARMNDGNNNNEEEETLEDVDPLGLDEIGFSAKTKSTLKMVTSGKFHIDGNKVIVTELPIGVSMTAYKMWLEARRDEKDKDKIKIKDFKMNLDSEVPYYEIWGFPNPTLKRLRLVKTYNLGNMVVLDENNRPKRFKTIEALIKYWYDWRLPFYEKRKQLELSKMDKQINKTTWKLKFVMAVINGSLNGRIPGETIVMMNTQKSDILEQTKMMQFPEDLAKEFVTTIKLYTCTYEEVTKLKNKLDKLINDRKVREQTPITDTWLNDLADFEREYLRENHYTKLFNPKGKK